jgi:hypothetical protein
MPQLRDGIGLDRISEGTDAIHLSNWMMLL